MPSAANKDRVRAVLHLDADAFFASVEQASDAKLRGKPVAVGGEKRGIIASASYEARRMGVYTPMPTARARKLCPKLIVVPGDFEKYERFSRWMFSYAYDFTPDVEISSIDEGYLELTANPKPPVEIARKIAEAIRGSLKITVSEAVGSNKLVTQIAAKMRKPAAFESVPMGSEKMFLHPLANSWLPGVGPKTAVRLNAAGLARIGQIAETPVDLLQLLLGKVAPQVREFANGLDDRPVVPVNAPAKSYGHQETFGADVTDEDYAHAVLRHLADRLMAQVREEGKSIRTITVKVRYNDMAEEQRSESLLEPTDLETDVYGRVSMLLKEAWKRRVSLRMVSLKFSNIYEGFARWELPLDHEARQREARRRLFGVVDRLREDHGEHAILRGHDFKIQEGPAAPEPQMDRKPARRATNRKVAAAFTPLQVRSYYSFLDSALPVERIVQLAAHFEMPAIAIADKGNLHGAVEFIQSATRAGIKPVIGAEIEVEGKPLCLYVQNEQGYRNLCRILTRCNESRTAGQGSGGDEQALLQAQRGHEKCQLWFGFSDELASHFAGLIAVSPHAAFAEYFSDRFYLSVSNPEAARKLGPGLKCVAALPVHYEHAQDRLKFDVVQSIRTRTLLRQVHPEKDLNGDFHFWTPREMAEIFGANPELLEHSLEIAGRCSFQFPFGKPQFPAFSPPDGSSPAEFLGRLVRAGLKKRYGKRADQYRRQVEEELAIINEVDYAEYFLAVWDILQDCRKLGIEWITRGSAADSLVCYCLEISDVCPIRFDLYFRRFLNKDRMALDKLPDIDLDFAHDVKDRVIDLIFEKYGERQVAVVGGFSTYKARGAVGDIAKVLGVSEFQIRRFTERIPFSHATNLTTVLEHTKECSDLPLKEEPYATTVKLAAFLDGFPRYPKMHPCGVVVSRGPMLDLTPCFTSNKGYPTTHFDMEAVEAIGLIKMDILAQGGLAVMRDVQKMLLPESTACRGRLLPERDDGRWEALSQQDANLHAVADLHRLEPWDDPEVWELIASGGARAVHHIESPAMIGLCRMCNVREIDGLIAIVSVIRPGAANEHKKMAFTRRYQGLEETVYPHPSLEPCLKSTFGMVVYEEHILQICEAFAGLPAGRADVLRRALGKEKLAVIEEIKSEFFECARRLARTEEEIERVWELVTSFRGYAFCKAHSTAYGVEAYQSAWLKRYYPAEFMAGVLSNGKGFYSPLVYILECHRLGISLLNPCVNEPGPAFTVGNPAPKPGWEITSGQALALNESIHRIGLQSTTDSTRKAIRVPATRVKGLTQHTTDRMIEERARRPFASMQDFYLRVQPLPEEVEALTKVGAFDGFGKNRTAQFWEMQMLLQAEQETREQGWLFPPPPLNRLPPVALQEPSWLERLRWENELLDFPVSGHPLDLFPDIAWDTYCPVRELGHHSGQTVVTCGLIIEERMFEQITGEPMKFLTIADYTGIIETELFAETYKSYGLATVRYPVLEITATVEPFENGRGHTLRVLKAGRPRTKQSG